MKKSFILLVILLAAGGWTANKFLVRASTSSEVRARFIEQAGNYSDNATIFLTEQAKKYHDDAFAASYRMWILSPVSELDLSSHYDEQTYYRTLGKNIAEAAKKAGQSDAYNALLDIAQHYGVATKGEKTSRKPSAEKTTPKPENHKDSMLKKSKLGEKRTIPSSRRRDNER